MMPDLKLKEKSDTSNDEESESVLDIEATFDVAEEKDSDFDLNMDSTRFRGKKGQAGSRTKN